LSKVESLIIFLRGTTARPPSSMRSGTATRLATANAYAAAPPTAQLNALGNVGNVSMRS
jgi:hypothetical protein